MQLTRLDIFIIHSFNVWLDIECPVTTTYVNTYICLL